MNSLYVTRHPVEGVDELHLSHPLDEVLVVGDDQQLEVALHLVALSKSACKSSLSSVKSS
jgi:hypothetical protein